MFALICSRLTYIVRQLDKHTVTKVLHHQCEVGTAVDLDD